VRAETQSCRSKAERKESLQEERRERLWREKGKHKATWKGGGKASKVYQVGEEEQQAAELLEASQPEEEEHLWTVEEPQVNSVSPPPKGGVTFLLDTGAAMHVWPLAYAEAWIGRQLQEQESSRPLLALEDILFDSTGQLVLM
jgi:hypothetical protein